MNRYEWQPHDGDTKPQGLRNRTRIDVMREDGSIDRDLVAMGWNWGALPCGGPRIRAFRLTRREAQHCPFSGRLYAEESK